MSVPAPWWEVASFAPCRISPPSAQLRAPRSGASAAVAALARARSWACSSRGCPRAQSRWCTSTRTTGTCRTSRRPRADLNFDHPDALESELLVQHLQTLLTGGSAAMPHYDFAHHSRSPGNTVLAPAPLLLVEGILLYAFPQLAAMFDYRVFIDVPEPVRLERRIARDVVHPGAQRAVRASPVRGDRRPHALGVRAAGPRRCRSGRPLRRRLRRRRRGACRAGGSSCPALGFETS